MSDSGFSDPPQREKSVPQHVAVIMDGNGRWARRRFMPRVAGHQRGSDSVRQLVEGALHHGIEHLTLFAFSTENWQRPDEEVSTLMALFVRMLEKEVDRLHEAGVRIRIIGDRSVLAERLRDLIGEAEALTRNNRRLHLTLAVNYGGRWDILQAVNRWLHSRTSPNADMMEQDLSGLLTTAELPEPDLFILTGGAHRSSNFLLWQLAYTEL